nr:hypothetical protein [Angustibacter aerolatus]
MTAVHPVAHVGRRQQAGRRDDDGAELRAGQQRLPQARPGCPTS